MAQAVSCEVRGVRRTALVAYGWGSHLSFDVGEVVEAVMLVAGEETSARPPRLPLAASPTDKAGSVALVPPDEPDAGGAEGGAPSER
jgi:hypothetical protein